MKLAIMKHRYWLIPLAAVPVIAAIAWLLSQADGGALEDIERFFLEPDAHPAVFFITLALLPLVGFPIAAFCILAGAKFGVYGGLAAIGAAMAWHLLVSYWLVKSYIKGAIEALLRRKDYQIPHFAPGREIRYAVAFTAIPVIPYAIKNILLAMSDLRWPYYFLIAWPIQMLYGFPLVALTEAARERNFTLLLIAGAGLLVAVWLCRWAGKDFKTEHRGD